MAARFVAATNTWYVSDNSLRQNIPVNESKREHEAEGTGLLEIASKLEDLVLPLRRSHISRLGATTTLAFSISWT